MTEKAIGIQWFDNHCHLGEDAEAIIERAHLAGVTKMITVGTDLAESKAAIQIAENFENVWATAGIHPHEAIHGTHGLKELLDSPQVVAVGEAGLDFYYDHSPRNEQKEVFKQQIELANKKSMPLVIHTREAWEETFSLLDTEGTPEHTVFHCFTGGPAELKSCLSRDASVSFSGIATFSTALEVRAAIEECPLEKLLLETDSPYLTPVPLRGQINEPANIVHTGRHIAEIKSLTEEEVAIVTTQNAEKFYRLSETN